MIFYSWLQWMRLVVLQKDDHFLNLCLVELVGLVIERTKSFPCVIVKKKFHVTCGVASF